MPKILANAKLYGREGSDEAHWTFDPTKGSGIDEGEKLARRPLNHLESVRDGLLAQLQVEKYGVADFQHTRSESILAKLELLEGALARLKQTKVPKSRKSVARDLRELRDKLRRQIAMENSGTNFRELQKLNEDPTATANLAGAAHADPEVLIDPVVRALGENRYEAYEPLG